MQSSMPNAKENFVLKLNKRLLLWEMNMVMHCAIEYNTVQLQTWVLRYGKEPIMR